MIFLEYKLWLECIWENVCILMYVFYFINIYSLNRVRRFDGNGINIFGKNVNVNLILVIILINRIVNL